MGYAKCKKTTFYSLKCTVSKTLFKFYWRISLLNRVGAQIITLDLLFLPSPQIFSVTTLSP